jgi:hypothetical protein
MLYTVVTFVGLFIIATTVAVIFYIKFEDQRSTAETLREQKNELATAAEFQKRGALIGAKKSRETYLGKMLAYLDETVSLTIGGPPEPTSAEVKVENVNRRFRETLDLLAGQQPAVKITSPGMSSSRTAPTNEFVELLAKKQFAAATKSMDENMKNALPANKLEQAWTATLSQMGPFGKQIGARTEKQAGYDVVFVTCEFEKGPLDVKVVYDNDSRVAGLFFVPTPADIIESYQAAPQQPARAYLDIETIDPNTTGLITIVEKLKNTLDNTSRMALTLSDQLQQLHNRFDDFKAETQTKEKELLAEKEKYRKLVNDIEQKYNELKVLLEQTSDERAQTLMAQRDEAIARRDELNADLLQTDAKLTTAHDRIAHLQAQLQAVMPPPDSNVAAYKPDGKIILVDNKIVHLNIGSDDRVYRGLTFSVYERNVPIPKDGRGKAEIEVFNVDRKVSAARVTRSQKMRPIVEEDIVANLVWDSDKTYIFAVVGEFDLDSDGDIEYDGLDKIKALIEKWGGRAADTVSVDTDFLVLGRPPQTPRRPTTEEIATDPMAMEKYEASLRELEHYEQTLSSAQALRIPIFNTDRFLHFIGYKALAARVDAF